MIQNKKLILRSTGQEVFKLSNKGAVYCKVLIPFTQGELDNRRPTNEMKARVETVRLSSLKVIELTA